MQHGSQTSWSGCWLWDAGGEKRGGKAFSEPSLTTNQPYAIPVGPDESDIPGLSDLLKDIQ